MPAYTSCILDINKYLQWWRKSTLVLWSFVSYYSAVLSILNVVSKFVKLWYWRLNGNSSYNKKYEELGKSVGKELFYVSENLRIGFDYKIHLPEYENIWVWEFWTRKYYLNKLVLVLRTHTLLHKKTLIIYITILSSFNYYE